MSVNNKNIAILCSRLDLPGGIEKAIIQLANLFTEKNHRVTLLILDETDAMFYPCNPKVERMQMPLFFGITESGNMISRKSAFIGDIQKLKKTLVGLNPEIIIATEYQMAIAARLAIPKKKWRIYSWEHHHYYELKKNFFWEKLFQFAYPRLDKVVCLNSDEQKLFARINHNSVIIPNFIRPNPQKEIPRKKMLLTVARLTHVKGIDLLLETARSVLKQHPEWKWKIIGDGEMKEEVEKFSRMTEMQDRLILQAPVHHNIWEEYRQSSIYVMTSRNECFPMVLLEALSTGTPCIAFDCETGPRHLIKQGMNGYLVEKENPENLATAINNLITNEELRSTMSKNACQSSNRFSPELIYPQWEKILA